GEGPVIAVDSDRLPEDDAVRLLFGASPPAAVSQYATQLGYVHLADEGTLVLAHVDGLPREAQSALTTYLQAASRPEVGREPRPHVKVVALSRRPLEELAAEGGLEPDLLRNLQRQVIELPPLRKRKADIVPLATCFLGLHAQRARESPKRLSPDARRRLLSYDYKLGNASELREVVERAAVLSDGDVVLAEHVFLGATDADEAGQIDILRVPALRRAARHAFLLDAARFACGLAFAAIIVTCLILPDAAAGKWANVLVWCVWWPVLVLSFFPIGRIWCAVCPLSWLGGLAGRIRRLNVPPPAWLKRCSTPALMVGFLLIVWSEHSARMSQRPFATGLLLVVLVLACAVSSVVLQRHSWCRYLCPLGAIGATFAACATMRLQATRAVCATQCTGHECFRGTDEVEGCPMFHHALFAEEGPNCKFCLNCLQTCPTESIRIFVQPPLRDLGRPEVGSAGLASFAVVLGGGALVLTLSRSGSPGLEWLKSAAGFGAACVAVLAVGCLMNGSTNWLKSHDHEEVGSLIGRLAYALVPTFWGMLFAYHVGSNEWLNQYALSLMTQTGAVGSLGVLTLIQIGAVAIGAAFTLYGLWRVFARFCAREGLAARAAWLATLFGALGYVVAGLRGLI
ncbi:MAG: sigma 54-interacting transcriptional regulator, partial [Armatimonadota bacterium]